MRIGQISQVVTAMVVLADAAISVHAYDLHPAIELRVQDFGGANGEFRDPELGISFHLPAGWKLERAGRWGDHETTLWLRDPQSSASAFLYYQFPTPREFPKNMEDAMRGAIEAKTRQRKGEGAADYRVRQESIQPRVVGGQQARSWVADYTDGNRKMVDYNTRIRSEKAVVLFFAHLPAADLDSFRQRFDLIIETLRVP